MRSMPEIVEELAGAAAPTQISALVQELLDASLMICQDGRYLSLAVMTRRNYRAFGRMPSVAGEMAAIRWSEVWRFRRFLHEGVWRFRSSVMRLLLLKVVTRLRGAYVSLLNAVLRGRASSYRVVPAIAEGDHDN